MKIKSKKIVFRVEENLYEFVHAFAVRNKMSMSELIRNVLIYFHTGYLLGEFTKSMDELEQDFLKTFPTNEKDMKKFLKRKRVKPLKSQLARQSK